MAYLGGYKGGKESVGRSKKVISLRTSSKEELVDITKEVNKVIVDASFSEGLCFLYVPHTTAAVFVNEGYDPSVGTDILETLRRLIPQSISYAHLEGNSPAHIKSSIIGVSLILPVDGGKLALGRWQSVFFAEFDGPRRREVWVWLR